MATQTTFCLPTVDFTKAVEEEMKPGTAAWELVRSQIEKAVVDYGCFEAIYPKLLPAECEQVFSQMRDLFALPTETKMRNAEYKPIHGYLAHLPGMPLYEAFGIDDADTHGAIETFSDLMWPERNHHFIEIFASWTKKMAELGEIIRRMILQILGVEKYFDSHIESTRNDIHANFYKAPENGTTTLGLVAHTDLNMFTILLQSGVNGLELCSKNGEWHPTAPTSTGNLFIITGDTFTVWSNGRIQSPLHRVMMDGEKERFSIGLFAIPKPGWLIKAPDELVDEEHPLLYKTFDYSDFLQFYAKNPTKLGLMKDFAGLSN